MANLSWRVITLIVWLAIFFNIERLDLAGNDTINLASGIYVLGLLAAVGGILPMFQRRPLAMLLAPTLLGYILILLIDPAPDLGAFHTYLTFTGLVMLCLTVILSYRVGEGLGEFAHAVEAMTFPNKGGRLHQIRDGQELVQIEMTSSRRHQRQLSLVLFHADDTTIDMMMHRMVQDIQRSMMRRYVLATVARVLSRYLRRTDLILEGHRPDRLIFVAPETDEPEAHALGNRMVRMAKELLGISARFSIATFPEHALTFEELLNVAEQRLREQLPRRKGVLDPEEEFGVLAEQRAHEQIPGSSQTEAQVS